MKKYNSQRLIPVLLMAAFAGSAGAAGLQLLEQNASGLGNAYAGSAAVAADASTIYFNPAGLTYLPGMQVVAAVNAIDVDSRFSNRNSTNPALITGQGGNGGQVGGLAFVPSLYFSMPLNPQWSVGLGINAPFGLKTEYDSNWVGRFHGVTSDVKTLNINPTLAFKVNDRVSLGAGVSWQRLKARLTSAANAGGVVCSNIAFLSAPGGAAACGGGALNNYESSVELKGDDTGWGYNLGAMFQVSDATRLGLSYRSAIKYTVTGRAAFQNPTVTTAGGLNVPANAVIAGGLYNGGIKLDVKLPDTWIFSGEHKLNDRWELLGDLSWTGWAKIPKLDAVRTDGALTGTTLSHTQENWRNTWRVALGANYQYSDALKLRMGTAYDQSPVDKDNYRTPRLPDNNRWWLSFGAQYKLSKTGVIDVGYSHLFVRDSTILNNGQGADTASKGLLDGTYSNAVDILAVQYTHNL
ncbi:MAG: outer membrane protein transport protein [Rhodocyclales bacterium]|nr:outer membrane protein transport protein [Rhodocyclales bacterium]